MKISAWRRVAASAFVAALVVGCVVSSGDDDNGNDGGVSGGSGGKGGSGGSTAGKSGSGGSSGSTAGTGGSAGSTAPYTCEPKDGGSLRSDRAARAEAAGRLQVSQAVAGAPAPRPAPAEAPAAPLPTPASPKTAVRSDLIGRQGRKRRVDCR